jgi:hypothetical protein
MTSSVKFNSTIKEVIESIGKGKVELFLEDLMKGLNLEIPKNSTILSMLSIIFDISGLFGSSLVNIGTYDAKHCDKIVSYSCSVRKFATLGSKIYQILFQNVTSIAETEQLKAEFKYKTLILCKIVHEFKNPLLTIASITK